MIAVHEVPAYACRLCSRPVGREILSCPDLPHGRCAFVKANLIPTRSRVVSALVLLGAGLVSGLCVFLTFVAGDAEITLANCIVVALPLILVGLGLYGTVRKHVLLRDARSRLTWTLLSFLGIPLNRRLLAAGEILPVLPSPLRPPAVPPSIAKYTEVATVPRRQAMPSATSVFRAALLGLWARGIVTVRPVQIWRSSGRAKFKARQAVYTISLVPDPGWQAVDGGLEKGIVGVLNSWGNAKTEDARLWTEGPPVYELVRAVYGGDVSGPELWLLSRAAREAAALGLGRLRGWPWKRLEPSADHIERVRPEQEAVNAWSVQLARSYPLFSQELDSQVEKGIRSRQQQDYSYN